MSVHLRTDRKRCASDALEPPKNKRMKTEQTGLHDGHPVAVPSTLPPSSAMAIEPAQNRQNQNGWGTREVSQTIGSMDVQKMENLFYGNFPQNAPQPNDQPIPYDADSESIPTLEDGLEAEQMIDLQFLDDESASEDDQTIDSQQNQQHPNTPETIYRAQEGFVNFDSARQSQIEAQRTERGSHSKTMSDEKDRFGKVAPSQNSQNLTERGIEAPSPGAPKIMGILGLRNIPLVIRDNAPQPAFQFQMTLPPVQTQVIDDNEAPLALFSQSMDYDNPFYLDCPEVLTQWMGKIGLGTEKNAASPEHSFTLGCSYLEHKKYSLAREYFTKALESDPENNALLGLASCDFYEGKYSEAIDRLKPVLNTSCAYAAAQFKMGCCYAKQNNLSEAIKHFNQVPRNYSFSSRAQYNIGCLYYNQKEKDYSNAINHFKNVSQNTFKFNAAQYYLSLCYIAQNLLDQADYHLGQIQKKSHYFSAAETLLLVLGSKQT